MNNVAIFASGSGSNAENLVRFFASNPQFCFPLILSNSTKAYVLERATKLNIPSITFTRDEFYNSHKINDILIQHQINSIILAGFLWLVPPYLIDAYPQRIVNIHPALLPKYGGKGMYGMNVHQAVKDNKDTETGITVHYVNHEYDKGSIIKQVSCKIEPQDNPETIAEKVHQLEYEHFPKIIESIWG